MGLESGCSKVTTFDLRSTLYLECVCNRRLAPELLVRSPSKATVPIVSTTVITLKALKRLVEIL
jgi:hypothetical protein